MSPSTLICGEFQSTPSARRATLAEKLLGAQITISIHALREESDRTACRSFSGRLSNFNPRPPRGERPELHAGLVGFHNISIHALREESDLFRGFVVIIKEISIHALREESDRRRPQPPRGLLHFNPRPPRGERPRPQRLRGHQRAISIHALREESDTCSTC